MKKDELSEGRKYLKELRIFPMKSYEEFYSALKVQFGEEYADGFFEIMENREDDSDYTVNSRGLYDYKNKDFETSMFVTGMYNADYFEKACNWFMRNKEYIKGRVLDSCCDNGILTCFIASRFPECTVVGVDKVESSIKVAKELAELLKLTNVSFVVSDINAYEDKELFDTIISSRSIGETSKDCGSDIDWLSQTFKEEIDGYYKGLKDYALTLSRLLKPEGYVVQTERTWYSQLIAGWQIAMNNAGFTQIGDTNIITAHELEEENCFGEFVFKHEKSSLSDADIIEKWFRFMIDNIEFETYFFPEFSMACDIIRGAQAKAMLEYYRYEQIDGFIIRKRNGFEDFYSSCGWLYCDKKKLVNYIISYSPRKNKEPQCNIILFIMEDKDLGVVLADMSTIREHAEIMGEDMEEHYFGDAERFGKIIC